MQGIASVHLIEDTARGLSGLSRDVTTEGMFLWIEGEIAEGHGVEIILRLPSSAETQAGLIMWSVGKVVRIERSNGRLGVAVSFEEAEIVTPEQLKWWNCALAGSRRGPG